MTFYILAWTLHKKIVIIPGEKTEQNFDVVFSLEVIIYIFAYFYVNVIILRLKNL